MASVNETETFQHYQVLRRADGTLHELGRGAMGVTYKAFDTNLRSYVALKVINALHLDSETARARFLREARAAAALRHRNIASVYHLGNDEQSFFYAMEFVDGQTIEALVKESGRSLPARDALQIALQVSRALGAAGKQGLVHRDIKPANIMVEREDDDEDGYVVKVIDFGLARSATGGEGSAHITMGGFVGTPQYASPEQLEEKDLDIRSDMYSLGVTLWYMLAGRPPFVGPLGSVFIQQLTKEPPWDQISDQPDSIKKLLARLLQKDPDKRAQTPAELRRDIEVCLRSLPAATGRVTLPSKPAPPTSVPGETAGGSRSASATRENPSTFSTPTKPVTPPPVVGPVAQAPGDPLARPAVITTGTLLSGRYDLGDFIGQGNNGRVFRARDLAREQRSVAVKVLHADVLGSEGERARLAQTLVKLRRAPHAHLIEVESFEQTPGCRYLVQEWVNGFTLVELLRSRGKLPVRETLQLLVQAAQAADLAVASDLNRLELGLHQILVHFPSVAAGTQAGRALLGRSIEQWPTDFSLKLDALGITREVGDSVTWGGDMTMMPAAPMLGRDTQTSIRGLVESSQFFALGVLTYELLNGAPPSQARNEEGRGIKYAALPSLNEDANDVLRRMLTPNPGFTSGLDFFRALCEASGVVVPLASSTTITPAVVLPVGGETMAFEQPVEARAGHDGQGGETLLLEEEVADAPSTEQQAVEDPASELSEEAVTARQAEADRIEAERREAARIEAERREAERLESERAEAERVEAERIETERLEAGRAEAARLETERAEAARLEAEQREAERIEAERVEAERVAAQRAEAARIEAEHREAARVEAARLRAEREETERLEAQRLEAERREAARVEAERAEAARREAARIEAARVEVARIKAEREEAARVEAARIKAEQDEAKRVEAARIKAEREEAARVEAAKLKAEREETARIEAARKEAQRVEAARIKAEREEAERLEAARKEAQRVEAARIEAARKEAKRVEAERIAAERKEAKHVEAVRKEAQRVEAARLENERRIAEQAEAEQVAAARTAARKAAAAALVATPAVVPVGPLPTRTRATEKIDDHVKPRKWVPAAVGTVVSLALLGGIGALVTHHGGSKDAVTEKPRTVSVAPTATPAEEAATTPAPMVMPSPVATPAMVNPVVDATTPPPVAVTTPAPETLAPTVAANPVVASTPPVPPTVRSTNSMPPPDNRAQHARDVAAARERDEREATERDAARRETADRDEAKREAADREAAKRETTEREAAKRDDDRREAARRDDEKKDAERKEAVHDAHKDIKPESTPKPKPVVAKASPKPKPAASTPDPNANRQSGPSIGFMR